MDIFKVFKETGALLDGHFLLTSGLHSDNYFQCAKVLQHPKHLTTFCTELASKFAGVKIDTVISPAIGGIVVGTEMGRILDKRTIFAERQNGEMTLRRGFSVEEGENILVVEDVVTTGGSVKEVIKFVESKGANVVGVGYIVDRSNGVVQFGAKQASLLKMEVLTYHPDSCPTCGLGIPVVKPGSRS